MHGSARTRTLVAIAVASLLTAGFARAEPVRVRHREGLVHGFLALSDANGSRLASGDLIQNAVGDRVTSRLVFHFRDGSLYDDTTIYSERERFRLISDHLVEKGPAFPNAIEMSVDGASGNVTVRYDDHGREKTESSHIDDASSLANGMMLTILKNVGSTPPSGLSLVFATPKPRVLKLTIAAEGIEAFETGGERRKARHFVVKAELGGVTGAMAKLLGKQPPDSHVWVLDGEAPAFVKSEQPMYAGGPLWTIELVSPVWPHSSADKP